MLILALMFGFVFGATGYRLFFGKELLRQGISLGRTIAALEFRNWLLQLPNGLKDIVIADMEAYERQQKGRNV